MHGPVFRVLGPLEATVNGCQVTVPAGKQRTLLATLLLGANQVVSLDELTERLWDDAPPRRPRGALHTYVTRLRQMLDRHGPGTGDLIRTAAAGYLIEVSDLDLTRFRRLVAEARAASERGDLASESDALTEGLALWRGPVLHDVRSDSLHRDVVPSLTEEHLRALDRRQEVDLALGRHARLVGELRALTARYPLHERFWRHLMLALHGCGRSAEALEAYGMASACLRDRLGVCPGPETRDLHTAILRGAPPMSAHPERKV
ncbi:AfsR/SARP family transcriptional regulator [Actinoallomurus sp. NPDC050550]|uniref:AfsR/SARP family transcriptional regulator n=1 Tax=Actinoallomurus sp. NPDC050550 TaxID=3154937 RepID=UPI0033C75579